MPRKRKYNQGKYKPVNPQKYIGDAKNIVYRSSYELKMFRKCDLQESIVKWSSEEVVIPYYDPFNPKKKRRYFMDIYLQYRNKNDEIEEWLIEVKPAAQTKPPKIKRKTKAALRRLVEWEKNKAKWAAARKFADKYNMKFTIYTEKELNINK